jgi:hypothetical protein
MKISELKSEIKNYIYEILSEEVNEGQIIYGPDSASKANAIKQVKNSQTYKRSTGKNKTDIENSIKQDTDGGIIDIPEAKETLDEARPSSALVIGDIEKANAVKNQYKGKWIEKMIDLIIDAGESGIGQSAVAAQLGKVQQAINPQVRALTAAGVFTTVGGAPAPSAPKEKIAKEKVAKVKPSKDEEETDIEDTYYKADAEDVGFDDEKEPSKKDIEKEKIATVSKFKIPQEKFEDFKLKLKTVVDKIKSMPGGDEKDRKMAALKQFIKNPELVKAFKERDVTIDTGDLIG